MLPWGLAADRDRRAGDGDGRAARRGRRRSPRRRTPPAFALAGRCCSLSAGAFGASINTATGRAVTSWFPRAERGLRARHPADVGADRRLRGRARAAADRRPLGHARRRCSCSPAFCSLAAVARRALWLVEGPVRRRSRTRPTRSAIRCATGGSGGSSHRRAALLIFTQVAVTGFVVLFLESQRGFSAMEAGSCSAAINVVGAAAGSSSGAGLGPPRRRAGRS